MIASDMHGKFVRLIDLLVRFEDGALLFHLSGPPVNLTISQVVQIYENRAVLRWLHGNKTDGRDVVKSWERGAFLSVYLPFSVLG